MTRHPRPRFVWITYNTLMVVCLVVAFITFVWSRIRGPNSFAGFLPGGALFVVVGVYGLRFRRELVAHIRERPRYWLTTGVLVKRRMDLTRFTRMHVVFLAMGIVIVAGAAARWWITS